MTLSSQLLDGEAIQVLKGVVPPIAATTAALLLAWRPWRRPPHTTGRAWGASLGLVLGFFAAFVAVKGYWPPFPALAGTDWFPYVGIAVAVVGLCVRTSSGQIPRRAMAALAVLASWLILRTMWTNRCCTADGMQSMPSMRVAAGKVHDTSQPRTTSRFCTFDLVRWWIIMLSGDTNLTNRLRALRSPLMVER